MTKYNDFEYGSSLYGYSPFPRTKLGVFTSRSYQLNDITGSDIAIEVTGLLPIVRYLPVSNDERFCSYSNDWINGANDTIKTTSISSTCTFNITGRSLKLYFIPSTTETQITVSEIKQDINGNYTSASYDIEMKKIVSEGPYAVAEIESEDFAYRSLTLNKKDDDGIAINIYGIECTTGDIMPSISSEGNEYNPEEIIYTFIKKEKEYMNILGQAYEYGCSKEKITCVMNIGIFDELKFKVSLISSMYTPFISNDLIAPTIVESIKVSGNYSLQTVSDGNLVTTIALDPDTFKNYGEILWTATEPNESKVFVQTQSSSNNIDYTHLTAPYTMNNIITLTEGSTSGYFISGIIPEAMYQNKLYKIDAKGWDCTESNLGYNYALGDRANKAYVKYKILVNRNEVWLPLEQEFRIGESLLNILQSINEDIKVKMEFFRENTNLPTPYCDIEGTKLIYNMNYNERIPVNKTISAVTNNNSGKESIGTIENLGFVIPIELQDSIDRGDEAPLTYNIEFSAEMDYIDVYFDLGDKFYSTTNENAEIILECIETENNPKHYQFEHGRIVHPETITRAIHSAFYPPVDTYKNYTYYLCSGWMDTDNNQVDPYSDPNIVKDKNGDIAYTDGMITYNRTIDLYWYNVDGSIPDDEPEKWNMTTNNPNNKVVLYIYDTNPDNINPSWQSQDIVYNNNRINNNQKQQLDLTMKVDLPDLLPNLIGDFKDVYKIETKTGSVRCNHYASPDARIKIKNFEVVFDSTRDIVLAEKKEIRRGEKIASKDLLPIYGTVSIEGVYDTFGGTIPDYIENEDYEFDEQNNCLIWGIDNQNATEPETGDSYYVTFKYKKPRYGIVTFTCDYTEKVSSNIEIFSKHHITREGSLNPDELFMDYDIPSIKCHYSPAIINLSCGVNHTILIDINNIAWGFGSNESGQLGINRIKTYESNLTKIGETAWKMIACGCNHTIGLSTNGELYGWGNNSYGQIGNDSTDNVHVPKKISDMKFKFVAAGKNVSFAIDNSNRLWGWGDNSFRQLLVDTIDYSTVPIIIQSITKAKSLSVYDNSIAVIDDRGYLYTWGENKYGQLGSGDYENQIFPYFVFDDCIDVKMGGTHCIACREDKTIYVCGSNGSSQLGSIFDTQTFILSPIFGNVNTDDTVVISCGRDNTAVIRNKILYMCGNNTYLKVKTDPTTLSQAVAPYIASKTALNVATNEKMTIVVDDMKHFVVYSNIIDDQYMKNMIYEYPKWETDQSFYNLFPDMFDTNMSLKILHDSLRYTVYDNNKYVQTKIDYDSNNRPYILASLNTKKASLNWNPFIRSGYYFEGKDRYYLYSEPEELILDHNHYPAMNNITFNDGAYLNDLDSYISYPIGGIVFAPFSIAFSIDLESPLNESTIDKTLFEIISKNNNSLSMKYNDGKLIVSTHNQEYEYLIDISAGKQQIYIIFSDINNILKDGVILPIGTIKIYINNELITSIDETDEYINKLLNKGRIVLGNNSEYTNGLQCKFTNFIIFNQQLSSEEISLYSATDFPFYNQDNISFKSALVDSIVDYKNFIATTPLPKQNAPITVENDGITCIEVAFIENDELQNYTIFNTIYGVNNNKKIYIPCEELDTEFDTKIIYDDVPITIKSIEKNIISLDITDEEEKELIGKTLNITYQPANNFFVDYTEYNSTVISLSSQPKNNVSIVYETSEDPYYLVQKLDLNPIVNPNNKGFIYVSNMIRPPDSFEVNISPQQINIDPSDYAVVVVDVVDVTGNPTSAYDLYVDAQYGKITPYINSVNIKDPYEYDIYKTIGSIAGRSCFIYTPPAYDELKKDVFKKTIPSKVLNYNISDLIGKWNLNGDTKDSSGKNLHAINKGTKLNSESNYVFDYGDKIVATNITLSNNCTIMASAYTDHGGILFGLNSDNGPDLWISGSNIYWNAHDGSTNIFKVNNIPVDIEPYKNGWHHYAVTNDLSDHNTILYIDGKYVGTAEHRNTIQTNKVFSIGGSATSNLDSWIGSIKDVVLYNSVLSIEEIGIIYRETKVEDYIYTAEIFEHKISDYITITDRVSDIGIVKKVDLISVRGAI